MAYVVYLSEQAKTELAAIKRSGDKKTIQKIAKLVDWIAGTPAHWNGTSGALEAFCLRGNVVKTHQQAISYDLRNSWSWDLCLRCLIAFSLWWQVNSFFNSILPILNTRSHFEPYDVPSEARLKVVLRSPNRLNHHWENKGTDMLPFSISPNFPDSDHSWWWCWGHWVVRSNVSCSCFYVSHHHQE